MSWEPIARIILRYGCGALAAWGWMGPEFAEDISMDPDLISVLALGLGFAVETWYARSKRMGGPT